MLYLAALAYAILASTFTLAKLAVSTCHPLFLIGVRMLCAGPLLIIFHKLKKGSSLRIKKEDFFTFFKIGIFHIFIPFCFEFWSLQYITSAKTAIIYSLTPFISAILSYFLLGTKYNWLQALGLLTGLLGLLSIFMAKGDIEHFAGEFMYVSVPEFVLIISVISASFAWFLIKDLMKKGYGIGHINGVSMLIGGILSFSLWLIFFSHEPVLTKSPQEFMLWTGLLILVSNVIVYNFYGWLIKHMSINLMSVTGFLCPIFASFYGWYFLNEEIGLIHVIALAMVISGLWLFYIAEKKMSAKVNFKY